MAANLKLRFVLTACLLGTTLLHILVFWLAWSDVVAGRPDFSIFYTAGLMLRRGQGPELYDNRLQWQTQREFTSAMPARQGPLPYNHPPFEAVLCVPLTYLSYFHAYVVWAMLNLLLLAGIVLILRPDLPRLCGTLPWLPLLAAVGFYPIAVALMQGQDSILLLALYTLAYAALRRGNDARGGSLAGTGPVQVSFGFALRFCSFAAPTLARAHRLSSEWHSGRIDFARARGLAGTVVLSALRLGE